MPPDDLPIDLADEDSTKSPSAKPPISKDGRSGVGAEAEVRGGAEQSDEPPLEQQQRNDRAKP
jgi:hypothetical protein